MKKDKNRITLLFYAGYLLYLLFCAGCLYLTGSQAAMTTPLHPLFSLVLWTLLARYALKKSQAGCHSRRFPS